MALHDISLPISPALTPWPGDPAVRFDPVCDRARGDEANVTRLSVSSHAGTHVDAPRHFVEGPGIDQTPLDDLVGPCTVVGFEETRPIAARDLEGAGIPQDARRVLLRTANSARWVDPSQSFRTDFVALTEEAARWIVARGIRCIGTDALSIAPYAAGEPVHRILLAARVTILEGLDLRAIAPGAYRLICLPLKLVGLDGAPARAILEDLPSGPGSSAAQGVS